MKNKQKQLKTKEKKVKANEKHGKQLVNPNAFIKKYDYDTKKDRPSVLKQIETFNKLVDERKDKIIELTKKISFDYLTYYCKGNSASQKFDNFHNTFISFDKIVNGKIVLWNAKTKAKIVLN